LTYVTQARIDNINITPEIVRKTLLSLDTNKSLGPDGISNKILKECASALCTPLAWLFNMSLSLGIFPDQWKEAMVTSLFKKVDRQIKKQLQAYIIT
jgi:hypothetical protein